MVGVVSLNTDIGVFRADQLDELDAFFQKHGFAILRGLYDPATLEAMTAECVDAQNAVIEGALDHTSPKFRPKRGSQFWTIPSSS